MRLPPALVKRKKVKTIFGVRKKREKVPTKKKRISAEMEKRIFSLEKKLMRLQKLSGEKFKEEITKLVRALLRDRRTFNAFTKYLVDKGKIEVAERLQMLASNLNFSAYLKAEDVVADAEITRLRVRYGKKWLREIVSKMESYRNAEMKKAYFLNLLLQEGPAKYTARMLELYYGHYKDLAFLMRDVYEEYYKKRYEEALKGLKEALEEVTAA